MPKNNNSFVNALDEEIEFVESTILDGGLLGAGLAAKVIGVSRAYVYRLGEQGRIQTYRIGGGLYFNAIDCVLFARRRRQRINDKVVTRQEVDL